MKWFKHISDSLDDPDIFQAMEKFGSDGYVVFFGILEILSREFDANNPGFCRVSVKFLSKKLQISVKKISKILCFFEKNGRFSHTFIGDEIEISCHKLSELCDEWTQRKLGSCSGVTRKILKHEVEVEVEVEVDKEYIPPLPPKPKPKKSTQPSPPAEKDVVQYFVEKGFPPELGKRAFDYYENGNPPWTDSTGKPVRAWKQKVMAVWMKPENRFGAFGSMAGSGPPPHIPTPEEIRQRMDKNAE